MRRKTIILSVSLVASVAALVLALKPAQPHIEFYRLTGHFSPIEHIETLQQPVAVTNWNSDGLRLADGRTVRLPGVRSLPERSAALTEAIKRGVEVGGDGRVWALVRIHHWCGNDPVREHIARVDLSDMLTFLRIGELSTTQPDAEYLVSKPGGNFSDWGWRIGEFLEFQNWQAFRASASGPRQADSGATIKG